MTTTVQNQNKITRRVSSFNEYLSGTSLGSGYSAQS